MKIIFSSYIYLFIYVVVTILKSASETTATMTGSACIAIGEMGRNAALLLPSGGENNSEGEITKLSLVEMLLKMIKTSNQPNKVLVLRRVQVSGLIICYLCLTLTGLPLPRHCSRIKSPVTLVK